MFAFDVQEVRRLAAMVVLLAAPVSLSAQGRVSGVVFDSLRTHSPLSGATVQLEGFATSAVTDERGRFRLTGIPAGRYLATFFHPWLDSIRTAAPAYVLDVRDGATATLSMAVPSWRTLSTFLCKTPQDSATAVVFGAALAAEDRRALDGARAHVEWFEMSFGSEEGLRRGRRSLDAAADSSGEFVLCGVPNDLEIAIQVSAVGQATGRVDLKLDGQPIAWRTFLVSLTDTAARLIAAAPDQADSLGVTPTPPGASRVNVVVLDEARRPQPNAIVGIRGVATSATTDAKGRASISQVPAGSQALVVRAVGTRPVTRTVALVPHETFALEVTLLKTPQELPTVTVSGVRMSAEREGFERRRRAGFGHFLDAAELKRLPRGTAALAAIPGITVPLTALGWREMPRIRKANGTKCVPPILVDGILQGRLDGWELDALLRFAVRLEVYTRELLPPDLFVFPGCGVIAIWTR